MLLCLSFIHHTLLCVCIYRVERRLRSAVPRDDVLLYLSVAGYITTITECACIVLILKKAFHFQPGLIFDNFCSFPTTYFFHASITHQWPLDDLPPPANAKMQKPQMKFIVSWQCPSVSRSQVINEILRPTLENTDVVICKWYEWKAFFH